MQKTTLIFDFDYTLADSSKGIFECANYALENLGYQPHGFESISQTIGHSLPETFRLLASNQDKNEAEKFVQLFVSHADKVMNDLTVIYPEVFELMPEIKKLGYKTGIVSTKYRYRIKGVLEREGLDQYFDIIVGGEDVNEHKPNPEGLLLILNEFGLEKKDLLYVGDSLVDAEAAKRADVDFIAVTTGSTTKEQFEQVKCKKIFSGLSALKELLQQV